MLNPVALLYLLFIVGFILLKLNWKRTGKIFLGITVIWLIIITTPFLPVLMINSLEGKYSQISDSCISNIHGPADIIILGGGHSDNKSLSPNNQLSATALCRLVEGIRIHRLIPDSRLVLSGYKGRSELPQALVQYRTAIILGIDTGSMAMQATPTNTRMEAEVYSRNSGAKNNLILVTSARHMPRAMMLFQNYGINPIAAPSDFILKNETHNNPLEWLPSSDNITKMKMAIHEYVGIIWARAGGN